MRKGRAAVLRLHLGVALLAGAARPRLRPLSPLGRGQGEGSAGEDA